MNKEELWKEIVDLVNATHFSMTDKSLFINLIQIYSSKK